MLLDKTRTKIRLTQTEITKLKKSIRPLSEMEADLRICLNTLSEPHQAFIADCAAVLSHGTHPSTLLDLGPSAFMKSAFGLALEAHGVEMIIAKAMEKAAKEDSGRLRISVRDRDEKLQALREKLYSLELEEEALLDGADRRHDANPAAVIGVPLDVAIDRQFLI